MIDWSINVGHIITIVVLGSGGIGFLYTMRNRVDNVASQLIEIQRDTKEQLGSLEAETKKIVDVLVAQGRHDERLNAMDHRLVAQGQRVDELSHRMNRYLDQSAA